LHLLASGGYLAQLVHDLSILSFPVSSDLADLYLKYFAYHIFVTVQAGCNGIPMLIVGRFVNGICIGITSSQVPVYLAEISRKEIRGTIIVIQQWAIEWGIFIMYLLV
jgi:MFS family permease